MKQLSLRLLMLIGVLLISGYLFWSKYHMRNEDTPSPPPLQQEQYQLDLTFITGNRATMEDIGDGGMNYEMNLSESYLEEESKQLLQKITTGLDGTPYTFSGGGDNRSLWKGKTFLASGNNLISFQKDGERFALCFEDHQPGNFPSCIIDGQLQRISENYYEAPAYPKFWDGKLYQIRSIDEDHYGRLIDGDPIEKKIFRKRRAEMIDDVYNTHIIKDLNRFIYDLSPNLSVQMNIANKVLDIEISDANTEAKHRKMNILKDDGYSWYLIESDASTFKANATNDYLRPVLKYLKLWLGRKNFR